MHIKPVSLITNSNNNLNPKQAKNLSFCAEMPLDSFEKNNSQNIEQKSFISGVMQKFQNKSKQALLKKMRDSYPAVQEAKSIGKRAQKEITNVIKLGRLNKFSGYIDYTDNEKLLFGDYNDEGYPSCVSMIDVQQGFKTRRKYQMINGAKHFIYTDDIFKPKEGLALMSENGKIYRAEYDSDDSSWSFSDLPSGFCYQEEDKNPQTGETLRKQEIMLNFNNPDKSYLLEMDSKHSDLYKLDFASKLWILKKRTKLQKPNN